GRRMRRAEVWAPRPSVVELQLGDVRHSMRTDPDRPGWWVADMPLQHGDRYGFVLDGEGPFPDPRSMSQPDGVHGLSRAVAIPEPGGCEERAAHPVEGPPSVPEPGAREERAAHPAEGPPSVPEPGGCEERVARPDE